MGLFLCLSSCKYFCDCEEEAMPCMFMYDQLVYTPTGSSAGEQLVKPTFDGDQPAGTFSAQPEGLAIDSLSGEINVNMSIADEYAVVYTLDDGKTTCETKVAIGEKDPEAEGCALKYSDQDSIFFPSNVKSILIRPLEDLENPDNFKGRFSVWPQGLDIDPATGVININTSEPGLTYQVTFTSENKLTVCSTEVTIGGVDYRDVILDFDTTVVSEDSIVNQFLVVDTVVTPSTNFDGGVQFSTEGREDGLIFADSQGTINVRGTLQAISGGDISSGFFQEFVISYSYTPPGQQELIVSEVEIEIHYFRTVEEIPPSLLDLLGRKNRVPETENGRLMHRHGIICGIGAL